MFGVQPTRAATEYGYIRPGSPIRPGLFAIERFVEKPDAGTATRYVAEGYLWNSGNFVFRAGFLLEEYRRFEPDSAAAVAAAVVASGADIGFVTLDAPAFTRATAKSIDYALMERTASAAVMPVSYGWSDVGSWQAVGSCRSATPPAMPHTAPRSLSIRAAHMSQARSTWSRCSALTT